MHARHRARDLSLSSGSRGFWNATGRVDPMEVRTAFPKERRIPRPRRPRSFSPRYVMRRKGGSFMKQILATRHFTRKALAIGATATLVFGVIATRLVSAGAVTPGVTIRGAIGGDFDSELPAGSVNGADWGIDQSFKPPASNLIQDGNVFVVVSTWSNGGGQTQPTTTDGPGPCTGTLLHPTAPPGDVCIYVAGGDNAVNLAGIPSSLVRGA